MALTFYRIVKSNPPSLRDFASYRELGIPLFSEDPEGRRLAEGLSVYATLAQARRAIRAQPFLGRFIAELVIPDQGPLSFARTGRKPGHHTIWCDPIDILAGEVFACVASVVPI